MVLLYTAAQLSRDKHAALFQAWPERQTLRFGDLKCPSLGPTFTPMRSISFGLRAQAHPLSKKTLTNWRQQG